MQQWTFIVYGLERIAMAVVAFLMTSIMIVVSIDVLMRYAFNSPLAWSYDYVSLYAMAGVFFLALAPSYRERAHVGVDIVLELLPARARLWSDLAAEIIGLCLFSAIAYFGFQRTWVSFVQGDVLAGLIPWPTWLYNGAVPLGCALLCLRLLVNAIENVGRLRSGGDPSRTDGDAAEGGASS